jgi:beta-galactosidase
MDRKYKKDAFYAYKAWLSDVPFVHLCGKRYVDRVEDVTKVTVYSNLPEVELFANGQSLGKKTAPDHFFYFEVPNVGETTLTAVAGEYSDTSVIRKVDKFNEDYRLKEVGAILNWFDVEAPAGRYSINDTISDIMKSKKGKLWFVKFGLTIKKKMSAMKKDNVTSGFEVDISAQSSLMDMMSSFTVLRMASMMGMANVAFTKEELLKFNKDLNKIKKPAGVK